MIKRTEARRSVSLLNTSAEWTPAWDVAIQRAGSLLRVQIRTSFRRRNIIRYMRPLRGDDWMTYQQWRRACRAAMLDELRSRVS